MEVPRWMQRALANYDPDTRAIWIPHSQRWGIYHIARVSLFEGYVDGRIALTAMRDVPVCDFVWQSGDGGYLPLDMRVIEYLADHDIQRYGIDALLARMDAKNEKHKQEGERKVGDLVEDAAGYYRQAMARDEDNVAPRHLKDLQGSYDKSLARAF
jgi:hypothetical protein